MECYLDVKDYADLLNTNIKFLLRKIPYTFYYPHTWGEGPDQKDHAIVATPNLLQLTEKYKLFTVNGQSSYKNDNTIGIQNAENQLELIKNEITMYKDSNVFTRCFYTEIEELNIKYNKACELLNEEKNKNIQQRSYLEFFIERDQYTAIINFIINDSRIWYCIIAPNNEVITNMPRSKIFLNNKDDIYNTSLDRRSLYKSEYSNINKILDQMYLCIIVCKDFDSYFTADEIMLECMKGYDYRKPMKKSSYFDFEQKNIKKNY